MRPDVTEVIGGLDCEDTQRLSKALSAFDGLEVTQTDQCFRVERSRGSVGAPADEIHMGAAGTPARFMMGFAASATGSTVVTGTERLCERPMGDLIDALGDAGIQVECLGTPGCLPVRIQGGPLQGDHWSICGETSSQFTSSLLLLASQQASGPITVSVTGNVVSRPYVDMTLAMMGACGIQASRSGDADIVVQPARPAHGEILVEPDASGMSYYLAAAAVTGTSVEIPGIGSDSAQGDVGLARAFESMGCSLDMTDDCIRLTGGPLKGIDIDMETMPDVVLTLAIVASLAEGTTRITNIANLRIKECDRIHAAAAELQRMGVDVEEGEDFLVIHPGDTPKPARIQTYDDHRVAMAFSILGLVVDGVEIEDPACVAKSFPDFWNELARFRAHHAAADD
jgi:3-phosphoshikimate 1-carboxyvinyltransferase